MCLQARLKNWKGAGCTKVVRQCNVTLLSKEQFTHLIRIFFKNDKVVINKWLLPVSNFN